MRFSLLGVTLCASLLSVTASGAPLEPSAKWVVDFGEAHCIAARDYKTLGNIYSLILQPSPIGDNFEVLIVRTGSGPEFVQELAATVAFDGLQAKTFNLSYGQTKPRMRHFDIYHLSSAQMEGARNARIVTFDSEHTAPLSFNLTSMPALLDNLAACSRDLKRYWNYDGKNTGAIASPASVKLRDIFKDDDFPVEARNRNQQGRGRFLLLIDQMGKVANCTVIESAGYPIFDIKSCAIITERGKFKPALDAQGRPVRSVVQTPRITYRF
ncbi:MAG: energy transducer TonB [Sphingomicrobium sp.]